MKKKSSPKIDLKRGATAKHLAKKVKQHHKEIAGVHHPPKGPAMAGPGKQIP